MKRRARQAQSGFTIVELVITMCIAAVLSSIAITQMRDYTRRARVSEVVLATTSCKNMVAEGYPARDTAPPAGGWGCEATGNDTKYAGQVQTSSDGVIRVAITNLDSLMNGRYVYLVPAKSDGVTAMSSVDMGNGVKSWICGSDWMPARNALPANCRTDTTTWASQTFSP